VRTSVIKAIFDKDINYKQGEGSMNMMTPGVIDMRIVRGSADG